MSWRFIDFKRYNPYFKTGLNQALIESVAKGAEPVIFLAGWDRKTVNIGYSQKIEDEVDLEKVEEDSICIVRRQGGGGTTYLTPNGEITWGIVAPNKHFPNDVNKIYEQVCGSLAEQLKEIGINAWHEPINDIVTSKGKISGSTIKQKNGVTYIGGTLLYENNPEEMFRYLTPSKEKLEDKPIENFKDRVSSVKSESEATFEEAKLCIERFLKKNREWTDSKITSEENEIAEELAVKYSGDKWLYRDG